MERGSFFLFILFFNWTMFAQAAEFTPYQAYIDSVEDGQYITVFNKPGLNWSTCTIAIDKKTKKEYCKEAQGWPSRDAKIKVISPPVKAKVFDPYTEEQVEETYVKVEFEYERMGEDQKMHHQKGEGYIELAYLSRSARNPFFGAQAAAKTLKDKCKDNNAAAGATEQTKIKNQTKDLAQAIEDLSIAEKAKQLSTVVGSCVLNPSTKKPQYSGNKNVYDHFVLPKLQSTKPPAMLTESGKPMTRSQLIEIDAMARTLYGEMAACYKHGLQYPMTVAKIIQNRSESGRDREFIKPPHQTDKPKTAMIATSPSQFSMWHQTIQGKKNNPLHHGLCPPQKSGAPFWRSRSAPKQEHDIWMNTVRIATEAVLYPKQFKKRTQQVQQLHYSSGMSDRPNAWMKKMKQVRPSIEGRKIERDACVEVWQE